MGWIERQLLATMLTTAAISSCLGQAPQEVPASPPDKPVVVSMQTCAMGREYALFVPAEVDPDKAYWLVVHAHGNNGGGSPRAPLAPWVERGDCIGIAPSFPQGFQGLAHESDQQLIGIAQVLSKQYKLRSRLFLIGHSAGAQFVHRFTLRHPQVVAGCVATSAGTWEIGRLNAAAAAVPIAISCGEKDTVKSTPDAPYGRLEYAKLFEKSLAEGRFLYTARYWPDAGHGGNGPGQAEMAKECFMLATTGLLGRAAEEFDKTLAEIDQQIAAGNEIDARAALKALSDKMRARQKGDFESMFEKAQWNVGSAGLKGLAATTTAYLNDREKSLAARMERVGLASIASILEERPSDAAAQLTALRKRFKGIAKVESGIDAAFRKLAAAPKSTPPRSER
jgi:predicted esterase